jgi:predicted Zn finger-like uncharacterized protein
MVVRCPKCFAASPLTVRDIGAAGRMVCCETCGTHWLARNFEDDPYAADDMSEGAERRAVEDAIIVEHVAPAFVRRASAAARAASPGRWLPRVDPRLIKRLSLVLAAFLTVLALRAPIVAALPNLPGGLPPETDSLQFDAVRSQTVELHGNSTLFVEGKIVNTSAADVALPAIRVTLRASNGAPVRSWLVEPSVAGLAPGRSIGFRSAVASPPQEATQVTLDLAGRQGT